jgi:2-oxoglutarate dehydrogenase E2 component (dihydrolipoamide succinyltransferase)
VADVEQLSQCTPEAEQVTTTRVTMPQLGETVTEGTIVRWYKQPGDDVAIDETLFDVSTDKVDAEVPSAVRGVLREIRVGDGEVAPVGTLLGLITTTSDEPVTDDAASEPPPAPVRSDGDPRDGGRVLETTATGRSPAPPNGSAGRAVVSPVVRSLLAEHRLAETEVVGSGRDGRITRADVLAAAAARDARPSAPPPAVAPPEQHPDDEVLPFTAVRRATADNLARSVVTTAHALVVMEVDYTNVDASRRHTGLTYLPYVSLAVIDGIAAFPHVNASVGPDHLLVHHEVNLGFAVDIAREALLVPVLHDAASLRLRALGAAVVDLAERARRGRLRAGELGGATFTVTGVGGYGTVSTGPIINPPQVAIVAIDGVRMRPTAVPLAEGGWGMAVRPIGNLSLSFDHRAFDGAYAAAFLAHVRDRLENRDWSAEH